jgi:hypothetical protein
MFGNTASTSQLNLGGTNNTTSQSSLQQMKSGRDAFLDNLDTINVIPNAQHNMAPSLVKSSHKAFGTLGVNSDSEEDDRNSKAKQEHLDIKDLSTEQEDMKAYMKEDKKQSGRNSPEFVSYGNEKQSELTDRSVPFKMKVDFDNTPGGRTAADRSVASG